MEEEHQLDEKYENGVYYDSMAGEFCQIREINDTIGLFDPYVNPDHVKTDPYYCFDEEGYDMGEAISEVNSHMQKVSEDAVKNPKAVVERSLRMVSRNDPNELMSIPESEAIDLMYAQREVKITER